MPIAGTGCRSRWWRAQCWEGALAAMSHEHATLSTEHCSLPNKQTVVSQSSSKSAVDLVAVAATVPAASRRTRRISLLRDIPFAHMHENCLNLFASSQLIISVPRTDQTPAHHNVLPALDGVFDGCHGSFACLPSAFHNPGLFHLCAHQFMPTRRRGSSNSRSPCTPHRCNIHARSRTYSIVPKPFLCP
jgi:hypothetical protein